MLFQILDNIRNKPKHVRDQYAFGIAVFCTLVIGGVWTLSLPSRFAPESQVAALASSTNAAPFTNFFTQLKNQFKAVKSSINTNVATTSNSNVSTTTADITKDALNLQLSEENKASIASSTGGLDIHMDTVSTEKTAPTILIATTSATTVPAR